MGRFVYAQEGEPSAGNLTTASRFDRMTGVTRFAPSQFGDLTIRRTSAKATSAITGRMLGADHEWKTGVQIERGNHDAQTLTPSGVRYVDNAGEPFQAIWRPSVPRRRRVCDRRRIRDRQHHDRRPSHRQRRGARRSPPRLQPGLARRSIHGARTRCVGRRPGTLYTWNIVSPRLGLTARVTEMAGQCSVRAMVDSSQGVLTGELAPFHPGVSSIRTNGYDPSTGGYTSRLGRGPRINLLSIPRPAHHDGRIFGWHRSRDRVAEWPLPSPTSARTERISSAGRTSADQYRQETQVLPDGRSIPVSGPGQWRGAPPISTDQSTGLSVRYNGLVMVAEKRRSHGWHAFGWYTFSRASGLQAPAARTPPERRPALLHLRNPSRSGAIRTTSRTPAGCSRTIAPTCCG